MHHKDNQEESPLIRVGKSSAISNYGHASALILLTEGGKGENDYLLDELLPACVGAAARLEDVDICSLMMYSTSMQVPD